MSASAPSIPTPQTARDVANLSAQLRDVLLATLQCVVSRGVFTQAQVSCPVLLGGPVSVDSSEQGDPSSRPAVHERRFSLPCSTHVPSGELRLAGPDPAILDGAGPALAALTGAVIDKQIAWLVADAAADRALWIANRDAATGLGNRRAWVETLRVEALRARRNGTPLTVLILDIDGLKTVNDTWGHAAGDDVIARTAVALNGARRATDVVCRLGGDEFGITAPGANREHARMLAARLRAALAVQAVPVSLGWAVSDAHGEGAGDVDSDALWHDADAAMYRDKRSRQA